MADWTASVLLSVPVFGQFKGAGIWVGRVWTGVTDISPPITTLVSLPASPSAPCVVDVKDETGLGIVLARAKFPWLGMNEVVYEDGAFTTQYSSSSGAAITGGLRLSIIRNGGWPVGGPIELKVYASDTSGNEG